MLLIPAIDVRGGRTVRLFQGDFSRETAYTAQPAELLQRYRALGAVWVHLVDLDGARTGTRANQAQISALAAMRAVRLQVGGGVRDGATLAALLRAGIDRVVIGSAALERPGAVARWLRRYGAERLCLAFDVRIAADGQPYVHTRGWTQFAPVTLWDALARFAGQARHVLCTDIERDGTLAGPNLGLYAAAVARFPLLSWQASGGVRDTTDLAALARCGVAAVISGRALLDERISDEELREFLPDASSPASTYAPVRS